MLSKALDLAFRRQKPTCTQLNNFLAAQRQLPTAINPVNRVYLQGS